MARVQYYCAATLDGFIADADDGIAWLLGYEGRFEEEGALPGPMGPGNAYEQFYGDVGALVSGSTTYEFVVDHMSGGGDWPYAGKPYWVLSSRDLRVPEGEGVDVRIVSGSVADLHREIAASAGAANLWIVGGGNVASQYGDAGLLDELRVTVVPVILGAGKPIFDHPLSGPPLQLEGTRTFETGMIELRYSVRRATASSANRAAT